MMKKRWIFSIIWIMLGVALIVSTFLFEIDEYWSSMGFALLVVGVLQLLRFSKYNLDKDYQKKVDIENNDERNRYLSTKAWAWAGYCYVLLAAVSSVVFKLMEQEQLMTFASGSVCVVMLLYWLNYLYLKKKY